MSDNNEDFNILAEPEIDYSDDLPRIYVSEYTETGFMVKYENIPEEVGYIEFNYIAH